MHGWCKRQPADYHRGKARVYRDKYPIKARLGGFNRACGSDLSVADIEALFTKQGRLCSGCGAPLDVSWQIDHIVARAVGGSSHPVNLQLLCKPCNISKHSFSWADFIAHAEKITTYQSRIGLVDAAERAVGSAIKARW
jgi:5-methylcytosine-specific restriction endonuclease McrA